ncbi:hypothetical protein CERZMDRAFT_100836 [Cercospora zeae-maydis SCOH1-5]|uniref:RNI-like protein n=1 Tax=Cercospora zeae-maydis SCOH1-5 TaxID=717836 RepID=A0A6A6F5Q9_9PEZI|nr:hypothetical protein CERZMDRAFT_100836 [Cercospora zeae-maydis SCOH1-5]
MASPAEDISYVEAVESTSKKWAERITRQGPWRPCSDPLSYVGPPSLPMPVQISDKASLAPFFEYLKGTATNDAPQVALEPSHEDVELLEFAKGVVYNDGRIDLCKMGTGSSNIGHLMEALRSYTSGKHFLLGNNLISSLGAREIAKFIEERPQQYETWYLAGNCIDRRGLEVLIHAMIKSPVITNVWLKRNPLGPGSAESLARLCAHSPALRTLDLDQTSLGNEGAAVLFNLLNRRGKPIALRHIYLNASGIGAEALVEISPTTARLLDAVKGHPTLQAVDIGQSYASEDLGVRFNWLEGEEFARSLGDLITCPKGTRLRYLNLSYAPVTCTDLLSICEAVAANAFLVWFKAEPLVRGGKSRAEVKAGLHLKESMRAVRERLSENVAEHYQGISYAQFANGPKRFPLSPSDVRHIDSIYRNRDAGMARRGLKVLNKWWEEGDETLQLIQSNGIELCIDVLE